MLKLARLPMNGVYNYLAKEFFLTARKFSSCLIIPVQFRNCSPSRVNVQLSKGYFSTQVINDASPTSVNTQSDLTEELEHQTADSSKGKKIPLYKLGPLEPFQEINITNETNQEGTINPHMEAAEFVDDIAPPLPVSFNLAGYANESETIKQLVQLGVDLSQIERKAQKAKYIFKLDFEKDIKNHIQFLHDNGVEADSLGTFITKNPYIFKVDLENLQIRINYLKSKKFSDSAVARIISKNPHYLSLGTKSVDLCLGYFQRTFNLSGDEVRFLITKSPKLVTYEYAMLREKIFAIKEEMGFSCEQMKKLLLMKPKVYMLGRKSLVERFQIVHTMMGISHERILQFPGILLKRSYLLKQRHEYLKHIGRAQYDPSVPGYVSLHDLATTTDYAFCKKCALTSTDAYNEFLKTL